MNKPTFQNLFKMCILAACVFIALSIAPFIFLYRFFEKIREKIILHYRLNATLPAIRRMKEREEKNKFAAMQKVLCTAKSNFSTSTPKETAQHCIENISLNPSRLIANAYKRQFIVELYKQPAFAPSWMGLLAAWTFTIQRLDDEGNLDYAALLETNLNAHKSLHAALRATLLNANGSATPYAEGLKAKMRQKSKKIKKIASHVNMHLNTFQHLLEELIHLLETPIKDLKNITQANRTFIRLYRQLLQQPLYLLLKYEPSLPHISLLHDFACAMWNDVHILSEYKSLGKAILIDTELHDKNGDGKSCLSLSEKLKASQACVAKLHHTNDHIFSKLRYGCTHFWHMMGTFTSQGGILRLLPKLVGVEHYDSHGTLSNNPSLQGTTCWQGSALNGAVNNCYGGTPTIGDDQIAPEFKALLQAVENNLLNPVARQNKHVLSKVIYNNLQNVDKFHGEGPRSRTLMQLNEKYPLSFKGTILAKDSALYLMKSPKDVLWENGSQFGTILKERMLLGLHAPEKRGHGFYFFGAAESWEPIFDAIISAVNSHFADVQPPTSYQEKVSAQGAYQEYVYALLISVIECQTLYELNQTGIEEPLVTALTACKENIDRGGMENMKYMYLRLPFNKKPVSLIDKEEYLVGVMNSRSLSARDRAILKNRMHQPLSFIEKVTPEQFNQTLTDLLQALNLSAKMVYSADEL